MVSMFTGSMMPMGMNMNNAQGGSNVHQSLKTKYGVGYEDSGTRPYAQPYPMAITPRRPEGAIEKSWFSRFIKKCFLN